jgi:hypothetical protein
VHIDKPNWQDWGGRWARRTPFMRHMKEVRPSLSVARHSPLMRCVQVLEELDIKYAKPVQPVLLPPQYQTRDRDVLGNAGYYAGSPTIGRAPVRAMRQGSGNA